MANAQLDLYAPAVHPVGEPTRSVLIEEVLGGVCCHIARRRRLVGAGLVA